MDEDIDIVVNTISIESILNEKALAESESAKQKTEETDSPVKKKKGKKRKPSSDEDSLPGPLVAEEKDGTERERRRSSRKSRPNNFYRNFDLDSDSEGESKRRRTYMQDDDYQPNVDNESPKKPKSNKTTKTCDKSASGAGGDNSDAKSATASRSSLDSSTSATSVTPVSTKTAIMSSKLLENKKKSAISPKIVKETSTPIDPLLTPLDILNNVPTSTSVTSISTPDISSTASLSPDRSTSPLIISNSADSELFGLGNIANVTSLRDTIKNGNGNNSSQPITKNVPPPSTRHNVMTLTKEQSQSASVLLKTFLNKTKGLGFLLNSKAEGLLNKKATTDFLKNTKNISFCIDKTLLLVQLAKNNLICLENEIKKNYADFSSQNNFTNHLGNGSAPAAAASKSSASRTNDDDSDCEIIEDASSNTLNVDGTKADGLSLLKRVEKSGISWKPTTGMSKAKLGSQEIQLPGQHAVWINKSIMVKKVPQAKPKQQSFFWMDGRTLKPPDSECGLAAWGNSNLNAADECFNIPKTLDRVNSIGWLNLAFNNYNINSLLSYRKITAKHNRASCSDLGESCSDSEIDNKIFTPIVTLVHGESQKHHSRLNNVNTLEKTKLSDSLKEICLKNINSHIAPKNISANMNIDTVKLNHNAEVHQLTSIENTKNSGDRSDDNISKNIHLNDNLAISSSFVNLQHNLKQCENADRSFESHDLLSNKLNPEVRISVNEIKQNMSPAARYLDLNKCSAKDDMIIKNCDEMSISCEDITRGDAHLENFGIHGVECDFRNPSGELVDLKHINEPRHSPETPLSYRPRGKTKNSDDFIPLYKSYDSADSSDSGSVEECFAVDNNQNPVIKDSQTLDTNNRNALKALLQSSSDSDNSDFSLHMKKKVFVKRCQKRPKHNTEIGSDEIHLKSLMALSIDAVMQKFSSDNKKRVVKSSQTSGEDLLQIEIDRLTDLTTLTTSKSNTLRKKLTKAQENRIKKRAKLEKEVLYGSESIGSDDSSDDIIHPAAEKTDKDLELELQLKSNLAAKHLLAGSSSESEYPSSGSDSLTECRKNIDESIKPLQEKSDTNQKANGDEKKNPEISASRLRDPLLENIQSTVSKKLDSDLDSDDEEANWIRKKKMIERIHSKKRHRRSTSSKNDSSSAISNCDIFDSDSSEDSFKRKIEAKSSVKRKSLISITEESEDSTAGCSKDNEIDTSKVSLLKSSSENSDSDIEELGNRTIKEENILTSPTASLTDLSGKGRKNIRKVINKASLADTTKKAAIEEENRLQRLLKKNTQFLEYFKNSTETKAADGPNLVLDFDLETKKPIVSVHPELVTLLKSHQIDGIKFIWDTCFESVKIASEKPGGGCILAHCMGLGKTLQVIALIHSVLTSDCLPARTVLICCPLSTVLNWVDEFKKWLNRINDTANIKVYELSKLKTYSHRALYLEDWQKNGGVFIMGYEMFRHLININEEKLGLQSSVSSKISDALVYPGPDIVVCDEGHLLRNENTMLAKSMNKITTRRRIVLTGTPLQNNLKEYYCMVNFVKPSLLGTQREYINRFENPIKNGQHKDSSLYDIKIMKKRSHVLHKMLEGCVQRKEVSELYPYLPRKQEYVLLTTLSECQASLYKDYLENYSKTNQSKKGQTLLKDFHTLQKIWTHPRVLKDFCEKSQSIRNGKTHLNQQCFKLPLVSKISNNLDEVICLEDDLEDEKAAEETSTFVDDSWWKKNVDKESLETPYVSNKFSIVFDILDECGKIGDKMLIFCTSLYTLNTLEYFLKKRNGWALGRHYYRLDGSVNVENRQKWCRQFNMENNKLVKLFLISTRAGGLGINMIAANRVIIMDVSWNPSHDVQSIFRVYRFGQKKDCYIYRLVALGTMEEKIYERSVTKQAISCRVIDEQQIDRHYNMGELSELYVFNYPPTGIPPVPNFPSDPILASVLAKHRNENSDIPSVWSVHEHDSLLKDLHDEQLDEDERTAAWLEYEAEKTNLKNLATHPIQGPRGPSSILDGILPLPVGPSLHYAYKNAFPIGPIIRNHVSILNNPIQCGPAEDSILPDTAANTLNANYKRFINRRYVGQSTIRPVRPPKPVRRIPIKIGQPIRKHYKPSPKKVADGNLKMIQRWPPRYAKPCTGGFNNVEITEVRGRSCHISPSGKIIKRSPGKPKVLKRNIFHTPKKTALPPINEESTETNNDATSSAVMDLTDLPDTPDKNTLSRRSSSDRRTTPDNMYKKRSPSKITPATSTPHKRTPSKSSTKKRSTPKRKSTPKRNSTPSTRLSIFRQYTLERLASSTKKLNFTETSSEVIPDGNSETLSSEVTALNDAAHIYTIQLE